MPQVTLPDIDAATIGRIKRELGEIDDNVAVRSALKISERILREMAEGGTLLIKRPDGNMRRFFVKPRERA